MTGAAGTGSSRENLSGVRACVFDAYGTLLDIASAGRRCADMLGDRADQVTAAWRTRQLTYAWLSSLTGIHRDFWRVTEDALDMTLAEAGIASEMLRARLLAQYRVLDAFPDTRSALTQLRGRGLPLGILSNGTPEMLRASLDSARLADLFDAVLSVESAGIYKPHPDVYRLACDQFYLPPEAICFVSSNYWDVSGASVFGFRTVWLNRTGERPDRLPGRPAAVIGSLADLPGLLGAVV